MPSTKLPDNGHTASQKITQQQTIPLGMQRNEEMVAEPVHLDDSVGGLHRQIHDALKTPSSANARAAASRSFSRVAEASGGMGSAATTGDRGRVGVAGVG